MRRFLLLVVTLSMTVASSAFAQQAPAKHELAQYSLLSALFNKVLAGEATYGWLKTQGDFGIGTFSGLDGEMVAFDGMFYQIRSDGKVSAVQDTQTLPFANVTFFSPDTTTPLTSGATLASLKDTIEPGLPSHNVFYAIRIDGTFSAIKARSVPAQQKPYPSLTEAAKHQAVFEFKDIEGTMAGFWCPTYVGDLNVPGFHLHFLSKDKTQGGHVLDFTAKDAVLKRATLSGLRIILPQDEDFLRADFSKAHHGDINAVEK